MRERAKGPRVAFRAIAIAGGLMAAWSVGEVRANRARVITADALRALTPEGYKVAKHIPWHTGDGDRDYRVAAFSDANEAEPAKPVTILLVGWNGRWTVHDMVRPHHAPHPGAPDRGAPNYFTEMSRVRVDSRFLILLRTTVFGGGSGSLQYFDFYDVRHQKLVLVKSFSHGRMEGYYFALHNGAIFDADLDCRRGERRGRSFVYTCFLDVKKYAFDGTNITAIGSARLHERQGPWFLSDSYRFMSVERALDKVEIFGEAR